MMRMALTEPSVTGDAQEGVPPPQKLVECTRKLIGTANRIKVLGWAGPAPLDLSAQPDPDQLIDKARNAKVAYIMPAELLFDVELKPILPKIQQLKERVAENRASWQLYRQGYQILSATGDYRLAAGAAHRLVLARVLPATMDALRENEVPANVRGDLLSDLAELRAIINQDLLALRATRTANADHQTAIQTQVAELQDEEHLLDVILRVNTKADVTDQDLSRAGQTYQKLVARSEEDSAAATDLQQNRRSGGR